MRRKFDNETEIKVCEIYLSGVALQQIADYFLVSRETIRKILIRNAVRIRSRTEHFINTPIKLKGKMFEIIEGHQLGDGSVNKSEMNVNYRFSLASKYESYTKILMETLKLFNPIIYEYRNKERNNIVYHLQTKFLISPKYRIRWYPNGKKIIPNNLKLTPLTCLYWYLDDGGFCGVGNIRLCTHCFIKKDIEEILIPQLQQILGDENNKIKVYMINHKSGYKPIIHVPRKFTKRFLEYIGGKSPIPEFDYKFDIKPYKQKGYGYL